MIPWPQPKGTPLVDDDGRVGGVGDGRGAITFVCLCLDP